MIGVLLLSAVVVWHDLGRRDVLGRDEPITIVKLDQPNLQRALDATHFRLSGEPSNTQPLYFLLQYLFWPLVQRNTFVFRFLSSVFALLTVAVTYKLGEGLLELDGPRSCRAGTASAAVPVLGALFTALLPLHIQYAQIARPYTLVALLSLTSAYFLIRAMTTHRAAHWAGFILSATLAFYNHYNALFVLVTEGLFAGVVCLTWLVPVFRRRQSTRPLAGPLLSFLTIGVLCLPGMIRLVGLPWVGLSGSRETGGEIIVQLTLPFFRGFFTGIGLATAWHQALVLGLMILGLLAMGTARRWKALLLAVLWLSVPFVILSVMKSPRPFEERYLIFIPPVALLLVGQGVLAAGQLLSALGTPQHLAKRQWAITSILAACLVLLLGISLHTYYIANHEDRLEEVLAIVESHAQPGDAVLVSPRMLVRPLAAKGAQVYYLTEHPSASTLDRLAEGHPRIWILYTSFLPPVELQEPLDHWVQARGDAFVRMPIKAPSALAYANLALTDTEARLKDRVEVLEALVQSPAGPYGTWVRYNILADAYEALGELYTGRGDAALATDYRKKAEEARAAVPPP
jgi:hypothetical protein